jgi:hypothetical protein
MKYLKGRSFVDFQSFYCVVSGHIKELQTQPQMANL